MALDREKRDLPYVAGRMIAIAEHYAGDKFGPGTISTMLTHPNNGVAVWMRYIDKSDEYYCELSDMVLPVTLPNEIQKGQAWIGYYHQKSAYGDTARGGMRPGSGRKAKEDRRVSMTVRVKPETRQRLEDAAHAQGISLGQMVDAVVVAIS